MPQDDLPVLDAAALRQLAEQRPTVPCTTCVPLKAAGWEALPGGYDKKLLQPVATLRQPGVDDPTLEEFHPAGTHAWSADAPIAPAYFPYNRCEVWGCAQCGRPFLRYTEYGGYYVEERVRELDGKLVVDAPLG